MKLFRAYFTPGSVVLAMLVVLLWIHRFHLPPIGRETAQILVVCLTFAGLWALGEGPPKR
jgi:hypothetical protein